MKRVVHRLYSDYCKGSRMNEYAEIIQRAKENGFQCIGVEEFFKKSSSGLLESEKYFINRHDIDTDPITAERFFEVEKRYNIKSTYYFRLSTWDTDLIHSLLEYGCEVGYHFEELATYCKQHKMGKDEVVQHFEEIRDLFKKNVEMLERKSQMKIKSIASHGDFVNRLIGIANYQFINDELLKECNIDFECYNTTLLQSYQVIISDANYPEYFKPANPIHYFQENHSSIYMLTHPRHWYTSWYYTTKENMIRLIEGLRYRGI